MAGARVREARWVLTVTAGLLVGPFFPASNVLFYVGTFIGERLLFFPSVGYCMLLAYGICSAASGGGTAGQKAGRVVADFDDGEGRPWQRRRRNFWGVFSAMLVAAYSVRTLVRNMDWQDEETLFRSAEVVRSGVESEERAQSFSGSMVVRDSNVLNSQGKN